MSMAYKADQGYWTRMLSAIGAGVLVAAGAMWMWEQMEALRYEQQTIQLIQGAVAGAVMLIGAVAIYWLIYRNKRTSEFLIATEGEMKKVNWSSRREVMGSAWVVIGISVIIAVILFIVDLGFSTFFSWIGVLRT